MVRSFEEAHDISCSIGASVDSCYSLTCKYFENRHPAVRCSFLGEKDE